MLLAYISRRLRYGLLCVSFRTICHHAVGKATVVVTALILKSTFEEIYEAKR